jgi:hypothetical protein
MEEGLVRGGGDQVQVLFIGQGRGELAKKEFQIRKQLYQQHLDERDVEQEDIRPFVCQDEQTATVSEVSKAESAGIESVECHVDPLGVVYSS